MGRVAVRSPLLSVVQLERIEQLAYRLLEQSAAKAVIVSVDGGPPIAAVGVLDIDKGDQVFSEKLPRRLRVLVRYDDRSSLGLVRLRLRAFMDELNTLLPA
jgi:hypothetical protein